MQMLRTHSGIHPDFQDNNGRATIDATQAGHVGIFGAQSSWLSSFQRQSCLLLADYTQVFMTRDGIGFYRATLPASSGYTNAFAVIYAGNPIFGYVVLMQGASTKAWTSPDGLTWTISSAIGAGSALVDLCFGNTLATPLLCAVGGVDIYTSPDAGTWTHRTPAAMVGSALTSVAWSPSLALFCTVGGQAGVSIIQTSPDGTTWTNRTGPAAYLRWVTWAADVPNADGTYGIFIAVGSGGYITTSPDGITWTTQTSGSVHDFYSVAWSGSMAVAVTSHNDIRTSTDGVTWTTRISPLAGATAYTAVMWSGSFWVATSALNTVISYDGILWLQIPNSSAGTGAIAVGPSGLEPALQNFLHTAMGADTGTISASTATTAITVPTIYAPPGGPCRVRVDWSVYIKSIAANDNVDVWVSDGTNTWAASGGYITTANGKCDGGGYSPVTYAPQAAINLTLKVYSGHTFVVGAAPPGSGPNSYIDAAIIPAN